jgi:2-amino-4-hydroxy-6-hydroxymethyldihydropteridine diphosphokinase
MAQIVYLALGTNLGNRLENLRAARRGLSPAATLLDCSPIYETPPWGYQDQPPFLNQAVKADTELAPLELLAYLKNLEAQLGRKPSIRNGPRLIDLDLLFYGELQFDLPVLTIPHPRLTGRAFVLAPLADIAPDLRHPVSGKTILELLLECDMQGIQKLSLTDPECI